MRKRYLVQLPILACLCVFAGAFAVAGHSTEGFGPKISTTLATAATAPGTTSATPLHAIVYGTDLKTANTALGDGDDRPAAARRDRRRVGHHPAGSLSTLAAQAGISYARSTPTSRSTGGVQKMPLTGSQLVTDYPVTDQRRRRLEERHHRQTASASPSSTRA